MRVLHASAWYLPHSIGGTEVYIHGLIKALAGMGVESSVVVPRKAGMPEVFEHDGVRVFTFELPAEYSTAEFRRGPSAEEMAGFEKVLGRGFDVYHQHALSRGCGVAHIEAAKRLGLTTVFTAHTPNTTCLRTTMMRWDRDVCDGWVDNRRCAACWAQSQGAPKAAAVAASALPMSVANIFEAMTGKTEGARAPRALTLLAARAILERKAEEVRRLARAADAIVVVSDWLGAALRASGAPGEKLVLSRHGLDAALANRLRKARAKPHEDGPVVFGFLGRWHVEKGIGVLLDAFRGLPADLPARLDVRATAQDPPGEAYRDALIARAGSDPRIRFLPAYAPADLPEILAGLDAVVVPSQVQETGPLVVLEAQAAGRWVIGSNIGAIPERVVQGVSGTLVPHDDIAAWTAALTAFIETPRLAPAGAVRTMTEVATETQRLYANPSMRYTP